MTSLGGKQPRREHWALPEHYSIENSKLAARMIMEECGVTLADTFKIPRKPRLTASELNAIDRVRG